MVSVKMVLRNVSYVKAQDMDSEQRKELDIKVDRGLIAIETHNQNYETKAIIIQKGELANYIIYGSQ